MKYTLPILAFVAAPAFAETAAPLSYEIFENAIPHIDLAACPTDLSGSDRFCRATLYKEAVNIFAFSEEGDQPLVGFLRYDAEQMQDLLKTPMDD